MVNLIFMYHMDRANMRYTVQANHLLILTEISRLPVTITYHVH